MNFWFPAVVILAGIVAYVCVTPGPGIFEQDIVLNQQAMRCFRFVTDFNRYPSWLDSVKAVTSNADPSSVMVGTEFELLYSKNYVGKTSDFFKFTCTFPQWTVRKVKIGKFFLSLSPHVVVISHMDFKYHNC